MRESSAKMYTFLDNDIHIHSYLQFRAVRTLKNKENVAPIICVCVCVFLKVYKVVKKMLTKYIFT